MSTLGKYFHDFPRLAKQSGYNFQLHRDKVNWIDFEKVDIQDIIDNRNLKILEQNLIHVINYDLEKECDVKCLDQNFVKLFKLAQLGIDYLSYCELYLDRCVILLQEQLSSYQEKCILLKEEIEKKDEELKRSKMKIRVQSQNCKCSKCDKIFLNEAYLKSHEKRRHGNAQQSFETKVLKDETQQTETENNTTSSSTQTIENKMSFPANESKDGTDLLKLNEQEMKIDDLKKDLEELRTRLNIAEKTIEEKRNDEKNLQTNFPNAVIPIIHSYLSPQRSGYVTVPGTPALVPSLPKQFLIQEDATEKYETLINWNAAEIQGNNSNRSSARQVNLQQSSVADVAEREESNASHVSNDISQKFDSGDGKKPLQSPPIRLITTDLKPVISVEENRAEKSKNTGIELEIEDVINEFENELPIPSVLLSDDAKMDPDISNEGIISKASTPFKKSVSLNKWDANVGSVQGTPLTSTRRKSKSEETLVQTIDQCEEPEKSKSLIKKIMTKKPPKIKELKTNFKNSFSQLRESVSSSKKNSDGDNGKSKLDVVEGLHNRLKELGVDPEWSGIPKETMKQKLNILEHHRNLLSKENRLYPFLRKKLEKHVLKKIQNNSFYFTSKKKADELNEEATQFKNNVPTKGTFMSESSELTLFDSDIESDVEVLDKGKVVENCSPSPADTAPTTKARTEGIKKKEEERESTDFSIFQASKFRGVKPQIIELKVPEEVLNKGNNGDIDLQADSDFDYELFEEQSMQTISQHMAEKDLIASFPQKRDSDPELLNFRNGLIENFGILKGETDSKNLARKKVFFAEDPVILETGSKPVLKITADKKTASSMNPALDKDDIDDDDDDWSIESEWTVNTKS